MFYRGIQFDVYRSDLNWFTVIDITHGATILFKVADLHFPAPEFKHGSFQEFIDKQTRGEWIENAAAFLRRCLTDEEMERKQFWFEQGRVIGGLF